jgi:superfamily I DNA and RNA helicase
MYQISNMSKAIEIMTIRKSNFVLHVTSSLYTMIASMQIITTPLNTRNMPKLKQDTVHKKLTMHSISPTEKKPSCVTSANQR